MTLRPTIKLIATPAPDLAEITDLLIQITAPQTQQNSPAPLDLVIALDTSGSMQGVPLKLASEAARQIYLQRGDIRLGLVQFHSFAEIAAPLQHWEGDNFIQALYSLRAKGSTALHAGWALAASMLNANVKEAGYTYRQQRVVLLTDGHANVGLCSPVQLAAEIRQGLARGVSTSTVGVGTNYDERLLELLAGEGDGSYHYASTPQELTGLFLRELDSLKAAVGHKVSLGLQGVEILDGLNDLPRLSNGRMALPSFQAGHQFEVLMRIRQQGRPLRLRLAWTDMDGIRHRERLEVTPEELSRAVTAEQQRTVDRVRNNLLLARQQRQIAQLSDQGRISEALTRLEDSRQNIISFFREIPTAQSDLQQLDRLQASLQSGDDKAASKLARSESYLKSTGRKQ